MTQSFDWGFYLVEVIVILAVYYGLHALGAFDRMSRSKRAVVFGVMVFAAILLMPTIWPGATVA